MLDLKVRQSHQHQEAERDLEFLMWLSRFRFSSAELLELRFGVSARMCRKRMGRLETAQLVISHQPHVAAPKLFAIGPVGRVRLGLAKRRPPRWETQVVHELAIGQLVAALETTRSDLRVLTERDCRRAQWDGTARYSVVCQQRQGAMDRWPDIVVEHPDDRRIAIEIELAPKTSERLTAILLGYLMDGSYGRVHIRCGDRALERRVRQIADRLGASETISVVPVTS